MYKKYGSNSIAYDLENVDDKIYYVFISYGKHVATIDKDKKLILHKWWDYSQTTRRNLYKFIYDFAEYEFQYNLYCTKNKRAFLYKMLEQKQIFFK